MENEMATLILIAGSDWSLRVRTGARHSLLPDVGPETSSQGLNSYVPLDATEDGKAEDSQRGVQSGRTGSRHSYDHSG